MRLICASAAERAAADSTVAQIARLVEQVQARRAPLQNFVDRFARRYTPVVVVLMMAFNMFSHGSQDLYPTFLKQQLHFDTRTVGTLTVVLNLGAIVGGLFFGAWSEKIGRRRAIVAVNRLSNLKLDPSFST